MSGPREMVRWEGVSGLGGAVEWAWAVGGEWDKNGSE